MVNTFPQPCDEAVIRAPRTFVPCPRVSEPWILTATILGSSMAFIDGTVVNVAFPALQKNLDATVLDLQWVVEAYALFLATLLLAGGSMGDRFGRRRTFCTGVALFAIASIGCAVAGNVRQLIVARAIQGVAGALLVPGSLTIISASFDEAKRGQAIGTWSGFTAITSGMGPVMGGWLIEHTSWRAAFLINVPLAIIVLLISWLHVPESRDNDENTSFDWPGIVLATLGLGMLVYGLIESSRLGFSDLLVLTILGGGLLSLAVFFFLEARSAHPMLPLTLFRSRNFTGANLLTLFLYTALGGGMFFLPLNLIQVQGYSATAAGAAWLPFIFMIFVLSRWSGGLVKKYGAKVPLIVGPIIAAFAYGLFTVPAVGGGYWTTFFPAMIVLGIGMAVTVAPLTTTVMNAVPQRRAGVASGINNAVSRIAGLLGIAVCGIVTVNGFNRELDRRLARIQLSAEARQIVDAQRIKLAGAELPTSSSDQARALKQAIDKSFVFGFRLVMLVSFGLTLASTLIALAFITNSEDQRNSSSTWSIQKEHNTNLVF